MAAARLPPHDRGVLRASCPTLVQLQEFNHDQWQEFVRDVLTRSNRAVISLGSAKGEDVVDAFAATITRLGQGARRMIAHALEGHLTEMFASRASLGAARLRKATDILALLALTDVPEAVHSAVAITVEKRHPVALRLGENGDAIHFPVGLEQGNSSSFVALRFYTDPLLLVFSSSMGTVRRCPAR